MRVPVTLAALAAVIAAGIPARSPYLPGHRAADTTADARNQAARAMLDSLGPRAAWRADSVWTDLKTDLRSVPAGRLIAIMNQGYGASLGVTCAFCHVPGHYAREDSTWKQVARDMMAMNTRINQELLAAIPNLRGPNPVVNCTTCHRGQVKPALNLGEASPR